MISLYYKYLSSRICVMCVMIDTNIVFVRGILFSVPFVRMSARPLRLGPCEGIL